MIARNRHRIPDLIKPGSAFHEYLLETCRQGKQALIETGLFNPATGGPQASAIEAVALTRMGRQELGLPAEMNTVVYLGLRAGVAHEALGNLPAAHAWYRAGQYLWRGGAHFAQWAGIPAQEIPMEDRDEPAAWQEQAGLCAALLGNTRRAANLFTWSAQNYAMSAAEMDQQEAGRAYQSVWQNLGFQVFALAWLERWDEIVPLAEHGRRLIARTRQAGHPKDFREPQLLIEIAATLADYFRQPGEQNLAAARAALRVDRLPDRNPRTRANMLPYMLALQRCYVELAP